MCITFLLLCYGCQVGGQTLCLLCTINFKKVQFKKKVQEGKNEISATKTHKQRDRHRAEE